MSSARSAVTRRRRDELLRRVGRAADAAEVFAIASSRVRALVPFDAAIWVTTDPATGLPIGHTRIEDVDAVSPGQCSERRRREFVVDDVNRFHALARAERPAGAMHEAAGDPARNARYRWFLRPLGFVDELRAVLRVAPGPGVPWP